MALAQKSLRTGVAPEVQAFEARILGEVIHPGTNKYEEARLTHNRAFSRRPALIVRAADTADVVEAVRFARAQDLPISVRSGGHSFVAASAGDGSLTIDLSNLKFFRIDPVFNTVWAQPGVTSGDLAGPAAELGLALSTGDVSTVGLGGLTTGGGIGYMVRKWGLTIDSLISAEVVTADGEVVTASAKENQDLFWAIRGGGGNFGIITGFEFKLHKLDGILGGLIGLPATTDALRKYLDFAVNAPVELNTIAMIMAAPPAPFVPEDKVGTPIIGVLVTYAGDPEEGKRVIEPLRAIAEPVVEFVDSMPYPAMYNFTEFAEAPHEFNGRSFFTETISDDFVEKVIKHLGKMPVPTDAIQIRPIGGGALSRVSSDATAFTHRNANYMVAVLGIWFDPADGPANYEWVENTWQDIKEYRQGVYVNFLGEEPDRIKEAYGAATYDRLIQVKRKYDPTNVFKFNQNINPA